MSEEEKEFPLFSIDHKNLLFQPITNEIVEYDWAEPDGISLSAETMVGWLEFIRERLAVLYVHLVDYPFNISYPTLGINRRQFPRGYYKASYAIGQAPVRGIYEMDRADLPHDTGLSSFNTEDILSGMIQEYRIYDDNYKVCSLSINMVKKELVDTIYDMCSLLNEPGEPDEEEEERCFIRIFNARCNGGMYSRELYNGICISCNGAHDTGKTECYDEDGVKIIDTPWDHELSCENKCGEGDAEYLICDLPEDSGNSGDIQESSSSSSNGDDGCHQDFIIDYYRFDVEEHRDASTIESQGEYRCVTTINEYTLEYSHLSDDFKTYSKDGYMYFITRGGSLYHEEINGKYIRGSAEKDIEGTIKDLIETPFLYVLVNGIDESSSISNGYRVTKSSYIKLDLSLDDIDIYLSGDDSSSSSSSSMIDYSSDSSSEYGYSGERFIFYKIRVKTSDLEGIANSVDGMTDSIELESETQAESKYDANVKEKRIIRYVHVFGDFAYFGFTYKPRQVIQTQNEEQ